MESEDKEKIILGLLLEIDSPECAYRTEWKDGIDIDLPAYWIIDLFEKIIGRIDIISRPRMPLPSKKDDPLLENMDKLVKQNTSLVNEVAKLELKLLIKTKQLELIVTNSLEEPRESLGEIEQLPGDPPIEPELI